MAIFEFVKRQSDIFISLLTSYGKLQQQQQQQVVVVVINKKQQISTLLYEDILSVIGGFKFLMGNRSPV